tara:strand:+ start:689 stop:916 length:228 start_codon:yes stop_codon:yes gene_type:complete
MTALKITTNGSSTTITLDNQQTRVLRTLLNYVKVEDLRQDLADELHGMSCPADIVKELHDHETALELRSYLLRAL